MSMCFTLNVECSIVKLSVVKILVSSPKVITIQMTVDSATLQQFKAIGAAFAFVFSSVSLEEYTIRSLVMCHHGRSIVHLNCSVIKGKSAYALLRDIKFLLREKEQKTIENEELVPFGLLVNFLWD
uniref:Uncharacterized protein n=1 Tax=Vespula pensylvanica TaxID=30213 RepID=A0A834MZP5_VESPE|nr:hypothetical protein H0235_017602 [Vespula pensylvanica]